MTDNFFSRNQASEKKFPSILSLQSFIQTFVYAICIFESFQPT